MTWRALSGVVFILPALAGQRVGEFTLVAPDGRQVSYGSLKGQTTVIGFVSTKCPVSNGYQERLSAIYREYSSRGIKFIFINSNSNESMEEMRQHARESQLPFPVYKDADNRAADQMDAQVTPEMFVIDAQGQIRYQGYVDDARNEARVTNPGLRRALDAVLNGQPVPTPRTKAFGCTIKRIKRIS